jgi:hypothetical protein
VRAAQHNPEGARQSFDESINAAAQYVPPHIQISILVAAALAGTGGRKRQGVEARFVQLPPGVFVECRG